MEDLKLRNRFIKNVEDHIGIIHKICNIYCNNAEDRQDLFQDVMLQLWKSYPRFKGKSEFSTWMYRVSLNTALYFVRKENKHPNIQNLDERTAIIPEYDNDKSELDEEVKFLLKAIDKLKKIDKAIIMLYLERKSYEDISEITGFSKSNVSVKLVRIKRQLEKEPSKSFN